MITPKYQTVGSAHPTGSTSIVGWVLLAIVNLELLSLTLLGPATRLSVLRVNNQI
jgi:hypothetical protein